MECHYLEWDSTFFGFNVCRLSGLGTVPDVSSLCRSTYLFAVIPDICTVQIQDLKDSGFRFVKQMVNLRKSYPFTPSEMDGYLDFDVANKDDLEDLKRIAGTCFLYSRFHADPILNKKADLLHEKWIENCFYGLADCILVHRSNSRVIGFIAVKKSELDNKIVLIGVDKNHQGEGCGKRLMEQFFNYSMQSNANTCSVRTELDNSQAINLYLKHGFSIVGSDIVMSKFLE